MAGHRADAKAVAGILDAGQTVHPADVDEDIGGGQTHVERRHQALSAGEDSRVVPAIGQDLEDVVEGLRPEVGEWGRFHRLFP